MNVLVSFIRWVDAGKVVRLATVNLPAEAIPRKDDLVHFSDGHIGYHMNVRRVSWDYTVYQDCKLNQPSEITVEIEVE